MARSRKRSSRLRCSPQPKPAFRSRVEAEMVDELLRRPSPWHRAISRSRTAIERHNSRTKLTFNLKYHKNRGRNAVEHCVLFAMIAMLGVAWVAVKTGHPEKIRSAWTWISLN